MEEKRGLFVVEEKRCGCGGGVERCGCGGVERCGCGGVEVWLWRRSREVWLWRRSREVWLWRSRGVVVEE